MTNRDKVLLYVICLLMLIFVPCYFVFPKMIAQIDVSRNQLEQLEERYSDYLLRAERLPEISEYRSRLDVQLARQIPRTSDLTKTYEVHYLMTRLAQENDVSLLSLQISDPQELPANEAEAQDFARFENESLGITRSDLDSGQQSAVLLQTIQVLLNCNGTQQNLLRMANAISTYSDYVVIDKISLPKLDTNDPTDAQLGVTIYVVSEQRG